MKTVRIISAIGAILMIVGLSNGFINGNFSEDGSMILSNPWGIVSLVDLYVGFVLFSMWIVFREKNIIKAVVLVVLMMVFGFLTGALYLFYVAVKEKTWVAFFFGDRAELATETSGASF